MSDVRMVCLECGTCGESPENVDQPCHVCGQTTEHVIKAFSRTSDDYTLAIEVMGMVKDYANTPSLAQAIIKLVREFDGQRLENTEGHL